MNRVLAVIRHDIVSITRDSIMVNVVVMLFVLAGALARRVLFVRVFHGGYSLGEEAGVPAGVASWGKQTPAAVTQP